MEALTGDGLTPALAIGGLAPVAVGAYLLAEPDRLDLILIPDVLFRSVLGGVDTFSSFLASSFVSLSLVGDLLIFEGVWDFGSYESTSVGSLLLQNTFCVAPI